nr:5-methylthioadenosine/S-adenosylhomocysteine deaminase-like isoform X1 [Tanacetum cinerariifolium]
MYECSPSVIIVVDLNLVHGDMAYLIVINPSSWSLVPVHDCENIDSVMYNWHWIMKNQKIINVDEGEIILTTKHASVQLLKRAGIQIPDRTKLI